MNIAWALISFRGKAIARAPSSCRGGRERSLIDAVF